MYIQNKRLRKLRHFSVLSIILIFVVFTAYVLNTYSSEPRLVVTNAMTAKPAKSDTPEIPNTSIHPEPTQISIGLFSLTAYCLCVQCCGVWSMEHTSRIGTDYIQKTASNTIPTAGRTISVDTMIIPFGTAVIIDGHEYIAEDSGGNIKGNRIDIFFDSHTEALKFGKQKVEVYIIN